MLLLSYLLLPALWVPTVNGLPNAGVTPRATGIDIPSLPSDAGIPDAVKQDNLYGAPANDFACRSQRNPVVLLHGLSGNREVHLNMLQRALKQRGYCAFSQTYGAHGAVPWVGGLTSMGASARDIAAFVRAVRDRTAAPRVDVVGYSEGGVQALYVPMTQPGIAGVVGRVVALGPAVHGARYFGVTDLWYVGGDATRRLAKRVIDALGCQACDDMAPDGAVYRDFKSAKQIAQAGNNVTVIMSRLDRLVAPEVSRIEEKGVNNVYIQDTCPDDRVGHAGLMWDKSAWRLVVNALEENGDEVFECEKGLEV
ncbi:alpha/beta-hydrolase [Xylariaceae sp. FL0662B]|nr:alpha/beta-hydrolase [Xylariaceae sp. FL0662B]